MTPPRVLLTYRHYPLTVARFFKWAMQRLGCEVLTAGPCVSTIPWCTWRNYGRYQDYPDIMLPNTDIDDLEKLRTHKLVEAFKPQLLVQIDAGYYLMKTTDKPLGFRYLHLATDPHCINYTIQFTQCDLPVIMQKVWSERKYKHFNPHLLYYAFDPHIHYYRAAPQEHDLTMVTGLLYDNRKLALRAMAEARLRVRHEVGLLYEEGTDVYLRGRIAFNWSSNDDLPMRFWEGLAYRNVVLTNRVPDLKLLEAKEDTHYLAFDTVEECVEKAKWIVENPEKAEEIARAGYAWVWKRRHTYTARAKMLLDLGGVQIE